MYILKDNFHSTLTENTVIALGSFDGLHLGHMALIDEVKRLSAKFMCKSMVVTFENHPLNIINANAAPKIIMSNELKMECLKESNIEILNLMKFDEELMKISPEIFMKKLVECYKPVAIVVGFNYRFGYKNLGDTELLNKLGKDLGFQVHIVNPVKYNKEVISSTRIRGLIKEGEIIVANKLLGHCFALEGIVIKGKQIGRTIGFPTVNLDYDTSNITPKGGVYYSNVSYGEKMYKGITNVGYNPTVNGNKLSIETNIIGFHENIYGKRVTIYFIKRIRDEKKFNSIEELKFQLEKDKNSVKKEKIIS